MDVKDLLIELRKNLKLFLASNKTDKKLFEILHEAFSSSDSPYDLLLKLTKDSGDFDQSKSTSLSRYVLDSFEGWAKGKQLPKIEKSLKNEALIAACGQRNPYITNQMIKLFEIQDESSEDYKYLVDDLIDNEKYDVACRLVSTLGLHQKVTALQFLVPLIDQNKENLVEDYLKQAGKEVQKELLQYLDSYLAAETERTEAKSVGKDVQLIPLNNLDSKIISKLIGRLAKKFNISEELLPNFYEKRVLGSIGFMGNQCFRQGEMTLENFVELSVGKVKDSRKLQIKLLKLLVDWKKHAVALSVAKKLDLPPSQWPLDLQRSGASQRGNSDNIPVAAVPLRKYYQLPFPLENMIYVDSLERFDELLKVMNKEEMIAFDAEWCPTFSSLQSPVSTMQIATGRKTVYMLDLIVLNGVLDEKHRLDFVNEFYRENLLVLGFGFTEDFSKLNKVFPGIHKKENTSNNVLDMLKLWHHVKKENPSILPYLKDDKPEEEQQKGLSGFVRQCFSTGLDKTEKMSDWGRRPLTIAQKMYAVIDAYVLLDIFTFLSSKYNPDDWKTLVDSLKKKKKKEKKENDLQKLTKELQNLEL